MTVSRDRPILIAGAGIAGLATAIALARADFRVALIERATRFAEVGAGLQLSPNASRVLIDLGLGPAIARNATAPSDLIIHRLARTREIGRVPMNSRNSFSAPFWVTLRADLQTALIDAARGDPGISFLVGRAVKNVAQRDDGVAATIETASGALETIEGAALVGADGLWSQARTSLNRSTPPDFTSFEAWRALVPAADAPEAARASATHLWMSRAAHLVHYPVGRGGLINVVLVRPASSPRSAAERESWNGAGDRAALADIARAAASPARELIARAPSWQVWSLYDRAQPTRWSEGLVALIGDAAHPVLPFLAQGAALAIEDAAVLADEAARSRDDLAAAFKRYADRRRDRAQRVQQAARANGRAYHARGPVAWARDIAIARLGEDGMLKRYDWLYGWTRDA